jgi:hypothetical protein
MLSVEADQERSIRLGLMTVAVRLVGAVGAWVSLKVAVTVLLAVRVNVQVVSRLVQPSLNPAKVEPVAAVAVRVIDVPGAKEAEQVAAQLLIPG